METTDLRVMSLIDDIKEVRKESGLNTDQIIKIFDIVSRREFTDAYKVANVVGFQVPSALEKIAMELSNISSIGSGLSEISESIYKK